MGPMRDADPNAGVLTQETMQKQNQSHAASNPTSPGDSADSDRQQTARRRYVELIRVSGRGQVERETPESQRRFLDRLARMRPGMRIARIEALAVSAAIPLEQTGQGQQLLELASDGFDEIGRAHV